MKKDLIKAWVDKNTHSLIKVRAAEKGIPAYEMYKIAIQKGINKDMSDLEKRRDNELRFF